MMQTPEASAACLSCHKEQIKYECMVSHTEIKDDVDGDDDDDVCRYVVVCVMSHSALAFPSSLYLRRALILPAMYLCYFMQRLCYEGKLLLSIDSQ